MHRFFLICVALFCFVQPAQAQVKKSVFESYESYDAFINKTMKARDISAMLTWLGGHSYKPEEVAQITQNLLRAWPEPFDQGAVFRREDLGNGVWQEGRLYWNEKSYGYYYAILHEREDGLIVLNFSINTNVREIMERF